MAFSVTTFFKSLQILYHPAICGVCFFGMWIVEYANLEKLNKVVTTKGKDWVRPKS